MRWSEKRKMLDFVPKCVGKALKGQKWVFSGEGGGGQEMQKRNSSENEKMKFRGGGGIALWKGLLEVGHNCATLAFIEK